MPVYIRNQNAEEILFFISTSSGSPAHIPGIAPHREWVPVWSSQFEKTANQTGSDCYGDDDIGVDGGDFGVLMSLLMTSGMNSETSRIYGESKLQSLGLEVLWTPNGATLVHTTHPTRRRVLNQRNRWYSRGGGRYVALRARVLNLMMQTTMVHVDNALSSECNKMIQQEGNAAKSEDLINHCIIIRSWLTRIIMMTNKTAKTAKTTLSSHSSQFSRLRPISCM